MLYLQFHTGQAKNSVLRKVLHILHVRKKKCGNGCKLDINYCCTTLPRISEKITVPSKVSAAALSCICELQHLLGLDN